MNWNDLLRAEVGASYPAVAGLIKLVDGDKLSWKPATGTNWLTTGQLLLHLATSCGSMFQGFVTGEWKDESVAAEGGPEAGLPPAEKYRAAKDPGEALRKLEADRLLCLAMIDRAGEADLAGRKVSPPWGGPEQVLGQYLLLGLDHLKAHKAQLFYYLKLQGKPVNTGHFYGM